jgi:hypothetical protein
MKRYKELDNNQKKSAVDYMFKKYSDKEIYRDINFTKPPFVKQRMKEIEEKIKFCGCLDCYDKLYDTANKDNLIKEWILSTAIDSAEQAYYPEEGDTVIEVK